MFFYRRKQKNEPEEEHNPKLKVEMQTIRLNSDSQKLVLDTLKFIHGPDFKLGSASIYKVNARNIFNTTSYVIFLEFLLILCNNLSLYCDF